MPELKIALLRCQVEWLRRGGATETKVKVSLASSPSRKAETAVDTRLVKASTERINLAIV